MQYVKPDILMVCELQNKEGADSILTRALNINGVTHYAAANFVTNQSTAQADFNNMMFYNFNKVTLQSQSEILTNTRDFNKYVIYANDPNIAVTMDTVSLDLYMAHLKAGSASSDSTRRASDCLILRNLLDSQPERNMILGGDLNLYSDQEEAYQLLTSGQRPFFDPSFLEGDWENNVQYAAVHTQSSRGPGDPSYDCGFNGGGDSRFDFLLTGSTIINETLNIKYIPNSYQVVANNGTTFNKAIDDVSNTSSVPMSVKNALYYMSDHLPVIIDLKITYPSTNPTCGIVTNVSNSGPGSLRSIIACSNPGDTIRFDQSINQQTINLINSGILLDKNLTLFAPGQDIIVYADDPSIPSTIFVDTNTTINIEGLNIIGESIFPGCAIENRGILNLKSVKVTNSLKSPFSILNKENAAINIMDGPTPSYLLLSQF